MHGCDSDIRYLVADLDISTANLFDTARAFAFIQKVPPLAKLGSDSSFKVTKNVALTSLENLAHFFLGVEMDKQFQVADWRVRPLLTGMLDYARSDSHYLIALYAILVKLLNPFAFESSDMVLLPV